MELGVLSRRNARFRDPKVSHLGPHLGAHLGPHLGPILEPILASSCGVPDAWKHCKNQWFLTLFKVLDSINIIEMGVSPRRNAHFRTPEGSQAEPGFYENLCFASTRRQVRHVTCNYSCLQVLKNECFAPTKRSFLQSATVPSFYTRSSKKVLSRAGATQRKRYPNRVIFE